MGQLNCCERRSDTNERKDKYTERYNEGVGKINHHEQYRVERTLRTTSSESGQQQANSIGTQSSLSGSVKVGQPRLNSFGAQSSSSGKVKPGQPRLNSFGAQSSSSGKVKLGQQQLNSIGAQSSSSGPLTAGKQGLYSIGVHSSSSDCVKVEKQRQGSIGAQSSLSGSVKLGHYQHVRIGTQMQTNEKEVPTEGGEEDILTALTMAERFSEKLEKILSKLEKLDTIQSSVEKIEDSLYLNLKKDRTNQESFKISANKDMIQGLKHGLMG
ncbi:uncharacterized protein LOC116294623 [Actinia tenebrosa]|uniref:Uncharacterized protein LOC116294623 n=1 Tax=Actinia tenebrosa TaxID=6105 RepID=A0A6P8HP19_ACTTE|nr:uncharacterized protein LOC116294623 [Actinia tenebrosa]